MGVIITGMMTLFSPEGLDLVDKQNNGATAKKILLINFSIPIVVAVLQIILLKFFFPYDSPITMKQNNESNDKIEEALSKLYHP